MKARKVLTIISTAAVGLFLVSGCSRYDEVYSRDIGTVKAEEEFNLVACSILNNSDKSNQAAGVDFNKCSFYGADFSKNGENKYNVEIYGAVKYDNESKEALMTMSYTLDAEYFKGLYDCDIHLPEIMQALCQAMKDNEMNDFSLTSVNNVDVLNSSIENFANEREDGHSFENGWVVSLDNPMVNVEDGFAAFQMKSGLVYYRSVYAPFAPAPNTYHKLYLSTQNVYVKASEEELSRMKLDSSLVYDKYIEYVNSGESQNYFVQPVDKIEMDGLDSFVCAGRGAEFEEVKPSDEAAKEGK